MRKIKLKSFFLQLFTVVSAGLFISGCEGIKSGSSIDSGFLGGISVSSVNSVLTVSSSSVTSGGSITVTLTLKDQNGRPYKPTVAPTIVFLNTGSGTSTGSFANTITNNNDGSFSTTFTGGSAGTATKLSATVDGSAITSTLPEVTVSGGTASLAHSTISVSAATVASTSTVTVTVTAKDTNSNTLSSGGLTVAFSHSGGTSTGTFSATTDNNNGTYTATFTGVTAGTATSIAATIGGSAITTASPTVTVTAGPISAATSTLSVSAATVVSGSTVTATLTAKDANSNSITSGGGTVAFSHSGGTSTGTLSATTDNNNGTYTATFTGVTAGTATSITATVGGTAVSTASPTVTVTPGSASTATSTITVSAATVTTGSQITVTVTAKDAAGNSLSSGGLTIALSHSGGTSTGTFTSVTDNSNGTYTSTFTGQLVGTATTIAGTLGGSSITDTENVTVTATEVSSNLTVKLDAATEFSSGCPDNTWANAQGGSSGTLTSMGSCAASSGWNGAGTAADPYRLTFDGTDDYVDFGANGGDLTSNPWAYTLSAWIRKGDGGTAATGGFPYYYILTKGIGESETDALDIGYQLGFDTTDQDAGAGKSYKVATGYEATSTHNNYPGTSTSAVANSAWTHVVVTSNGTSSRKYYINGTLDKTESLTETGSSAVDARLAVGGGVLSNGTTPTGFFKGDIAVVHIYSSALGAAAVRNLCTSYATRFSGASCATQPGASSRAHSTITLSASSVTEGSTVTVTLQAKDASGTNRDSGGDTVVFSSTGGTAAITIGATTDNSDGTYTATITGVTAGTAKTITATLNGSSVTTAEPTLTVAAIPSLVTSGLVLHLDASDIDNAGTTAANACTAGVSATWKDLAASTASDGTLTNFATAPDRCTSTNAWMGTATAGANPFRLNFAGDNDHLNFGASPPAELGLSKMTLAAWICPKSGGATTTTGTGGVTLYPVIAHGRGEGDGSNVDANFTFGLATDYKLTMDFEEGSTGASPGLNHPITGGTALSHGAWYYAAVTFDYTASAPQRTIYLNGSSDGSDTIAQPPRNDSIQDFSIGTAMTSAGAAAGYFSGALSAVHVYNKALTAAEILQNYQNGAYRFSSASDTTNDDCAN